MNLQVSKPLGDILVVDDIPDNLRVLSAALSESGYRVRCAKNGAMALLAIQKEPPQLILLDIKMPDLDGYQVCEKLKEDATTRHIPIIFLSAFDDVLDKVKAFAVGGADYISKPFQIEEVVVRIEHQLALQTAQAKIVQLNAELESQVQSRTAQLEEVISELNLEIIKHEQTQEKLLSQTLHDALTGLPNRILLMEHLQKSLQRSQRNQEYYFAVLFIDLDRFKIINDSWGHTVGDQLIVAISKILKSCTRVVDTVARLSGDEFAILLDDLENWDDAIEITERLLEQLSTPIQLEERTVFTGASIGIVFGSQQYQDGVEVLRDADIAMYRAKNLGKGRYAIFDQDMYAQTKYLSQIETDLRYVLSRKELHLCYQPIISLHNGQMTGFEALVRWQHPTQGLILPSDFITIAEDTGLIIPIGEWVLQEACQQLRQWHQQFPAISELHVSVNLSSRQIKHHDFATKLETILKETGLSGNFLRLELTESMLMDQSERTLQLLSQIKANHVQLSIDDFGTGYSSLSYLHRFPIDTLKIDRSFVNQMDANPENSEIVKTIITLAHALSMEAIAEGVETPEQIDRLKDLGCESVQGYFFSKPISAQAATRLLAQNPKW
jgi:diguanylate cyclase (GGDEF)-like protein